VLDNLSGPAPVVTGAGVIVTLASLALCIPLVVVFNKYVPQLVGKPKIKGPLLNTSILHELENNN